MEYYKRDERPCFTPNFRGCSPMLFCIPFLVMPCIGCPCPCFKMWSQKVLQSWHVIFSSSTRPCWERNMRLIFHIQLLLPLIFTIFLLGILRTACQKENMSCLSIYTLVSGHTCTATYKKVMLLPDLPFLFSMI